MVPTEGKKYCHPMRFALHRRQRLESSEHGGPQIEVRTGESIFFFSFRSLNKI